MIIVVKSKHTEFSSSVAYVSGVNVLSISCFRAVGPYYYFSVICYTECYVLINPLSTGHGPITIHGEASWGPEPPQRQTIHVPTITRPVLLPSEKSFTQVRVYKGLNNIETRQKGWFSL